MKNPFFLLLVSAGLVMVMFVLLRAPEARAATAKSVITDSSIVFQGQGDDSPGAGKHIVLVSGDEEYRSEEAMPMLAKILADRFGFKCTVLFAIDPETGFINPQVQTNIPGLEALASADLMILATRFRNLPDDQLQHIVDYLNTGKPIIGLRTATHAFKTKSKLGGVDWNNFGLNYLGEKWAGHHGHHKVEGCRGVIEEANKEHPILRGVGPDDVFATSDVYGVSNLDLSKATILMRGQVTETLEPDSKPVAAKNDPMQAAVWLYAFEAPNGTGGTALTSTMGASVDFESEGLRRIVVNGVFHLTGLEVPEKADVTPVDPYAPTFYSTNPKQYYNEELKLTPGSYDLGKSPATGLKGR